MFTTWDRIYSPEQNTPYLQHTRNWYSRRDSNSHCIGPKPIASAVGLREHDDSVAAKGIPVLEPSISSTYHPYGTWWIPEESNPDLSLFRRARTPATPEIHGGDTGDRTLDLKLAKLPLSHLSYIPINFIYGAGKRNRTPIRGLQSPCNTIILYRRYSTGNHLCYRL